MLLNNSPYPVSGSYNQEIELPEYHDCVTDFHHWNKGFPAARQ